MEKLTSKELKSALKDVFATEDDLEPLFKGVYKKIKGLKKDDPVDKKDYNKHKEDKDTMLTYLIDNLAVTLDRLQKQTEIVEEILEANKKRIKKKKEKGKKETEKESKKVESGLTELLEERKKEKELKKKEKEAREKKIEEAKKKAQEEIEKQIEEEKKKNPEQKKKEKEEAKFQEFVLTKKNLWTILTEKFPAKDALEKLFVTSYKKVEGKEPSSRLTDSYEDMLDYMIDSKERRDVVYGKLLKVFTFEELQEITKKKEKIEKKGEEKKEKRIRDYSIDHILSYVKNQITELETKQPISMPYIKDKIKTYKEQLDEEMFDITLKTEKTSEWVEYLIRLLDEYRKLQIPIKEGKEEFDISSLVESKRHLAVTGEINLQEVEQSLKDYWLNQPALTIELSTTRSTLQSSDANNQALGLSG